MQISGVCYSLIMYNMTIHMGIWRWCFFYVYHNTPQTHPLLFHTDASGDILTFGCSVFSGLIKYLNYVNFQLCPIIYLHEK